MRRWLTLFLVLLIPMQFAFASAAAYCELEQEKSRSQHFGHHEHGDEVADPQPAGDDGTAPQLDNECGICHLGCSAKGHPAPLQQAIALVNVLPDVPADDPAPDRPIAPADRPPRARLA